MKRHTIGRRLRRRKLTPQQIKANKAADIINLTAAVVERGVHALLSPANDGYWCDASGERLLLLGSFLQTAGKMRQKAEATYAGMAGCITPKDIEGMMAAAVTFGMVEIPKEKRK